MTKAEINTLVDKNTIGGWVGLAIRAAATDKQELTTKEKKGLIVNTYD